MFPPEGAHFPCEVAEIAKKHLAHLEQVTRQVQIHIDAITCCSAGMPGPRLEPRCRVCPAQATLSRLRPSQSRMINEVAGTIVVAAWQPCDGGVRRANDSHDLGCPWAEERWSSLSPVCADAAGGHHGTILVFGVFGALTTTSRNRQPKGPPPSAPSETAARSRRVNAGCVNGVACATETGLPLGRFLCSWGLTAAAAVITLHAVDFLWKRTPGLDG